MRKGEWIGHLILPIIALIAILAALLFPLVCRLLGR